MKYIITLFLLYNSLFSDNIELNLKQFAELVSEQHKVNIIIDDKIEVNKFTFFLQKDRNKIMLPAFKKMLFLKNFDFIYDDINKFYFITIYTPTIEQSKIHFFKLDSPVFNDIKNSLTLFDIPYTFIENSNTLVYLSTLEQHKNILKLINFNDDKTEQFNIKLTILETNLNEVKDRGFKIDAYTQDLQGTSQSFIHLLTTPYFGETNVFENTNFGITSIIKFMDENSFSKIISSPFFLVQSNKQIFFNSVENIPYRVSQASVNGATQTSTQSTEYKDIGLKIKLLPKIIKDVVFIDLDLVVENIIDKSSETPSTSKRSLLNSFYLKKGQTLVLSGINQSEKITTHYGVPFLKNIPYLGSIFKYDSDRVIDKILTITIEVL